MQELGIANKYAGNYEEAERLFKQSWKIYEKTNNLSDAVKSYVHLGNVYTFLGKYKEAEKLLEEGLNFYKERKEALGYAWTLRLLGCFYNHIGHYKKAQYILEQSLTMYNKWYGDNHIKVLELNCYLTKTYIALDKLRDAQECLKRVEEIYGENPNIDVKPDTPGKLYARLGHYEEAENCLNETLTNYRKYYGEKHPRTAEALNDLGEMHFLKNELEKAKNYLHQACAILEKNSHPDLYISLELLGEIYLKKLENINYQNNKCAVIFQNKAIKYFNQALNILKKHFPHHSPHIKRLEIKIEKYCKIRVIPPYV